MNSTMYVSTDTIFDEKLFKQINVEARNTYTTEPMPAIKKLVYQQPDEEELHTSFEEAISDRLLALHSRLDRLSNPTLAIQGAERNTDPVLSTSASIRNTTAPQKFTPGVAHSHQLEDVSHFAWKRMTIFACSAIMFLLLGFDLMGLLVLHMH
jgi:pimeloyl-ACP methyl ester carboxylesterase